MDINNHPLVSVFVVTYNAGDYICETLDSIKAQTYDYIELIVSDDHSSDDTVRQANVWIEKNKARFVRTELITIDHNTGVSANYNRAVRACSGEWVKNVDGDDLIMPNCIEDNVNFVNKNHEAKLVFSNAKVFKGKNLDNVIGDCIPMRNRFFFELSAEEQFKYLLKANIPPSQTCFVSLDLLRKYPYDEKYVALEDAPMWLKLTRNGNKAYYFDSYTAYYRKGDSMTSGKSVFFSTYYVESVLLLFWNEMYQPIKENNLLDAFNNHKKAHLKMEIAIGLLHNKKNTFNYFIYRMVAWYIEKYVKFDF